MKKSYLLIMSALLLTSTAFAQKSQRVATKSVIEKAAQLKLPGSVTNLKARSLDGSNAQLTAVPLKKALEINDNDTVIYNVAEGVAHKNNARSGFAFYSSLFGISGGSYSNRIGTFVKDNRTIYLQDPFGQLAHGSYLKLTRVGGIKSTTYVAKLPQPIYYDETNGTLYATRLTFQTNDEGSTYAPDTVDAEAQNAYFTYENGVLTMADSTIDETTGYPTAIIGLTDADGGWYGYGDNGISITPIEDIATEKPESAEPQDYVLAETSIDESDGTVSTTRSKIKVAIQGSSIYINNPASNDPKSWIQGTLDGDTATFEPQYIGPDSIDGYHLWFRPATYETYIDSTYYYYYGYNWFFYENDYTAAPTLKLKYDAENKTLTAPASTAITINAAPDRIYYLKAINDPAFTPFTEKEAVPVDPEITLFSGYNEEYGYGYFNFTLDCIDTDSTFIDPDKLTYSVYIDDPDEPYVFTADEYANDLNPGEEETEIPYNYSGYDIYASGNIRQVYFYVADIDSIGVQAIYRGLGVEHRSNIAWYNVAAANGIKGVNDTTSGVKSVAYYDISGRRVATPTQSGLYIKETTYADGTKKGAKFLKR